MRSASDQPEPKPSRRRRLRKWTVRTVLVVVALIGVTLLFLPQIATRVLTRLTAGLELEQFETEVEEVGWNTATLSTLSAGNPGWKAEADGVLVRYSPWDLLRGQIQSLSFDQLRIEITQDAPSPETPPDEQPASKASAADTPSPTGENPFAWLHTLPETLAACPRMEAPQARLLSKRGTQQVQQTVDLTVQLDSRGSTRLVLRQDKHRATITHQSTATASTLAIELTLPEPRPWVATTESLVGADNPWLPTELTTANLDAEIEVTISDTVELVELSGSLDTLRYDTDDPDLRALSSPSTFEGAIRPGGESQVALQGTLVTCAMRNDIIPGGAMALSPSAKASWSAILAWGEKPFSYLGTIAGLALETSAAESPLRIEGQDLTFSNQAALFRLEGDLSLNELKHPFTFAFNSPTNSPEASPNVQLAIGPITLDRTHPLFPSPNEVPEVSGTAKIGAQLRLAPAEDVSGAIDLHLDKVTSKLPGGLGSLGPLNGDAVLTLPKGTQPPTLHFVGKLQALTLDTSSSLGFPLAHTATAPADIQLDGNLTPDDPSLVANIAGLKLQGQHGENEVAFAVNTLALDWHPDKVAANASAQFGKTPLALDYSHTRRPLDGEQWLLEGALILAPTTIVEPLTNLGAFSETLEGLSLRGTVHSQLNFATGPGRPTTGTLRFNLSDGSVALADQLATAAGLTARGSVQLPPEKDLPVSWDVKGTLGSLTIDSSASLGFPLTHANGPDGLPATFTASGTTGAQATSKAEITALALAGEQHGEFVRFDDSSLQLVLTDESLAVDGRTTFADNEIPFSWRATTKDGPQGAPVTIGELQIPVTNLTTPITNLGAFSTSLTGWSIAGQVGAKLAVGTIANPVAPSSLEVSLAEGSLILPDDGPVLSGIKLRFLTPDLTDPHTTQPEAFSMDSVTYGDLSFTQLTGSYQILPGGDLKIPRLRSNFLGGHLRIDPFTYPADDRDFRLALRFQSLDLRTLTALFPAFDGKLDGRIDGHLPVVRKNGSYLPERGRIQLSPNGVARLRYNADSLFTGGLNPKSGEFKRMKIAEDSLKDLRIPVLTGRLFDPNDQGKAAVIRIEGQSAKFEEAPPIHLNFNIFEPEGDFQELLDYFFKNREKLDFGL